MKRHLLLGLLLLCGGLFGTAQTVVLSNNFGTDAASQASETQGWIISGMDNDDESWGYYPTDEMPPLGFSGNLAASFTFDDNGPVEPENIYISPLVDLSAYNTSSLTFKIASMEVMSGLSINYNVLVVTQEETEDPDFDLTAVVPTHSATLTGTNAAADITVDLSSFAGQQVYIIFHHSTSIGVGMLLLDDIEVTAEFVSNQTVLFNNNFGTDPASLASETAGWTIADMDNDGESWEYEASAGLPGFSGNLAISYTYEMDEGIPLTPENLYISPPADLSGYNLSTLTFTIGSMPFFGALSINYKVLVVPVTELSDPDFDLSAVPPSHSVTLTGPNAATAISVDLSAFTGQTVIVIFQHSTSSGVGVLLLDDIMLTAENSTSCATPTNLGVSDIVMSGAKLSWTAGSPAPAEGYEYYISESDTTPGANPAPIGTSAAGTTTTNITGLDGDTLYYVWIRSNCGSGTVSDWSVPVTFTTTLTNCLPGTDLEFSDITGNSATISWTAPSILPATGYDYYVSETNSTPGPLALTGSVSAGVTSAEISGLDPLTTYYVWVRGNCDTDGLSGWSVMASFTTVCSTSTIPTAVESFETTGLPQCWTSQVVSGSANWAVVNTPVGSQIANAHSGSKIARLQTVAGSYNAILASPAYDYTMITEDTRISVWLHRISAGEDEDVYKIFVNTSPSLTGAVEIQEIHNRTTGTPVVPATGWYRYIPSIPASFHGEETVYVIIQAIGTAASSRVAGVDDFQIQYSPDCLPVTNVEASSVTSAGATISWTAPSPAPAMGYQYYISQTDTEPDPLTTSPTGFVGPGITSVDIDVSQSETYYVWVRSNCDDNDNVSGWGTLVTFDTPCVVLTLPTALESFEDTEAIVEPYEYELPACWTEEAIIGNNHWINTIPDFQVTSAHTGTKAMTLSGYNTPNNSSFLASPAINYSAVTEDSRVNVWLYRHSDAIVADKYKIYVNSAPSMEEATLILELNSLSSMAPAVPGSGWYNYVANIPSSYNGVAMVYVLIVGELPNQFNFKVLGVDDFMVEMCSTISPTATDVQTFCSGAVVTDLEAAGTDIKWYSSVMDATPLSDSDVLVSGVYYASQTLGCESINRKMVTVVVNNPDAPIADATQTFCSSGTVGDLTTTGTAIQWYADETGGTALEDTQALTDGGIYYASQTIGTCESIERTMVTVNITTTDQPMADATQTFCNAATVGDLEATGTAIQWYADETGGTALEDTQALTDGGIYYASQTIGTCESTERAMVTVVLNTPGEPTADATQTFCNSATVGDLAATGTAIQWYADETGGTALEDTQALTDGGVYYASQTIGTCESIERTMVTIVLNTPDEPTADTTQTFCNSATVSDLEATGTAIQWYADENGGTALEDTHALTDGGVYYASQTIGSCESTERAMVTISINAPDAPDGNETQVISVANPAEATIEDIVVIGEGIIWYPTEADALGGTGALDAGTPLVTSTTYYATQTIGGCTSTEVLAVEITVVLGNEHFDAVPFRYYPNPVRDNLILSYNENITSVTIFNLLGQEVINKNINTTNVTVDMSSLSDGAYVVNVIAGSSIKTFKVIVKK